MTNGSNALLVGATDLAREHGHAFVGTEHLFASLLGDDTEPYTAVLRDAGLDLARIKEGLLKGLRAAPEPAAGDPPVSRFARQAVDRASLIARSNGRPEPMPEDLLAALLEQPRGRILETLGGPGPVLESIRDKVVRPIAGD